MRRPHGDSHFLKILSAEKPFQTGGIARPIGSLPRSELDLEVGGAQLGESRHFVKPETSTQSIQSAAMGQTARRLSQQLATA